jgi:cellulose synthase/poly-beta-1,6-N-acetylglucosamine synthase-like glycosyltransferase
MAELFFISIIFIFHSYFGYPFSLLLIGMIRKKHVRRASTFPDITLIITAHNEEKRIKEKLNNTLALEYPKEKLQIIVASDGSTDRTNDIVKSSEEKSVELLSLGVRRGKENAQREAVKVAKGDLLVFTDVATQLEPMGLKQIVSNFADPSVGCVSSEDRLVGKNMGTGGEGFYVRYEMWLRRLESRVNSLVGLSGSFFAARKEVCQDFSEEMQSDFRTVLNSLKLGFRGVSDPGAIGYYQDVSDENREFDRKVRTVLRGLTVFFRHLEFLNIFRYGMFSYQYFCHKLLRWMVPLFLIIAIVSNVFLFEKGLAFILLFAGQLGFYGLAIWGWRNRATPLKHFVKIPTYFFLVNVSILVAWWKYLRGQRVIMWAPSER